MCIQILQIRNYNYSTSIENDNLTKSGMFQDYNQKNVMESTIKCSNFLFIQKMLSYMNTKKNSMSINSTKRSKIF